MANQSDELRVVIMKQPHVFGMRAEYVNPLLLYYSRIAEEPDCDSNELVIECFQFCKSNVEQKHYELTHPEVSDSEYKDNQVTTTNGKNSTSNSKIKGKFPPKVSSNGTGITSKQLRYLGYLWRQLGEEPNYDEIGKLTQIQATMRIKTLEDKLGLTS